MTECTHLLGIYSTGLGHSTELIYSDNEYLEQFKDSYDFQQFKYCAHCGVEIETLRTAQNSIRQPSAE